MGRSVVRDEQGKFVKATLSSDEAAEMGKVSHAKRNTTQASKILFEAGFDEDNPAPELLKVLVDNAVSGKTGSVGAVREIVKWVFAGKDTNANLTVGPGEVCPTCGQYNIIGLRLTDAALEDIELLRDDL